MAINFPGPHELRFSIATSEPGDVGLHQLRLQLDAGAEITPGMPFGEIDPVAHNGTTTKDLAEHVEDFLELLAPIYSDASSFGTVELWEYEEDSFDALFRTAYSPTAQPTNANPVIPASQAYFTFRSAGGGVMKVCLMGTAIDEGPSARYPFGEAIIDDVFEYFISLTHPFIARDNTRPLAALSFLPGKNERLWKKLNRS